MDGFDYHTVFGEDLDAMKEAILENRKDDGIYVIPLSDLLFDSVTVTYLSEEGIYFSGFTTGDADSVYQDLVSFARENDLKIYNGAVRKLGDYIIREHIPLAQSREEAAELYFQKLESENVSKDEPIHYLKATIPFIGSVFRAFRKTEDTLYIYDTVAEDEEIDAFRKSAEEHGYKLKSGIPKDIQGLIERMEKAKEGSI